MLLSKKFDLIFPKKPHALWIIAYNVILSHLVTQNKHKNLFVISGYG